MIRFEFSGSVEQLVALLEPDSLAKAQKAALSATQAQTATQVSRKVRERYNVTAKAIASRLRMGLRNNNAEAYLLWKGTRIGLIEFGAQFRRVSTPRGKRWGATARIDRTKGREIAAGGFIAKGQNNNVHIFRRVDQFDNKSKLRRMSGPSIPQMVGTTEVLADAEKFVAQKYPDVLLNRLQFFFEKQMSR